MHKEENSLDDLEEALNSFLSKDHVPDPTILNASRYSTLAKAKRLRPRFTLAVGGKWAMDAAIAIELIHTYSLIHDDLPCMDDDDIRRGQPSLHIAFGEANAVLTGDFLLTQAFELLVNAPYSDTIRCKLMRSITSAIGASGLIGGQVLDMGAKERNITWKEYQEIALKKTSMLFIAALQCGAIIKGLGESDTVLLTEFGALFGLSFQIADDLDDGDYPSARAILGQEKAESTLASLCEKSEHILTLLSTPIPFLENCIKDLVTN